MEKERVKRLSEKLKKMLKPEIKGYSRANIIVRREGKPDRRIFKEVDDV